VTVRGNGCPVTLEAWTYCYGYMCADGFYDADELPVLEGDEVTLEFPEPGWTFEATFTANSGKRGRTITTDAQRTSSTAFQLTSPKTPGTWVVELFGRGNGDGAYSFTWQTDTSGNGGG
jgi:hypothetical protein